MILAVLIGGFGMVVRQKFLQWKKQVKEWNDVFKHQKDAMDEIKIVMNRKLDHITLHLEGIEDNDQDRELTDTFYDCLSDK